MSRSKDLSSNLRAAKIEDKEKAPWDRRNGASFEELLKTMSKAEAAKVVFQELCKAEKYRHLLDFKASCLSSTQLDIDSNNYVLYAMYKDRIPKSLLGTEAEFPSDSLKNMHPESSAERQLLHIAAQKTLLKDKTAETAYEIYQKLLEKPHQLDDPVEVLCNREAALSESPELLKNVGHDITFKPENDTYDVLFNKTLQLCVKHDFQEAWNLAMKTLELAENEGSVDTDDLRSIKLLVSYVNQMLGNKEEAKSILQELIQERPDEKDLISTIAKYNLAATKDMSKFHDNMPLILKESNATKLCSEHSNLSHFQNMLFTNGFLSLRINSNLKVKSNKSSSVAHANKFYTKHVSSAQYEPYENQARTLRQQLRKYQNAFDGKQDHSLLEHLVCIQVLLKAGNFNSAIVEAEIFWKLNNENEVSAEKRIISYILFQLYDMQNRTSSITQHLSTLLKQFSEVSLRQDTEFWEYVAFKLLEQGENAKAENLIQKCAAHNPTSASAKYVSEKGINGDEQPINADNILYVIDDIDVSALINAGIRPFQIKKNRSNDLSASSKKKRRVHKNKKILKNFDHSQKPDPERWLPLKERSTYKVSKKNISGKTTQGFKASKASEAKLDINKKKSKTVTGKNTSKGKSKSSKR